MGNTPVVTFDATAPLQGNLQTDVSGQVDIEWSDGVPIQWPTSIDIEWPLQTTFYPDTQVYSSIPVVVFLGIGG